MLVNAQAAHLILASVALVSSYPADPDITIVNLGYTQYQGTKLANGITQWLGMRYAAPPIGDLRFRAPQDPIPKAGVQIADTVIVRRHKQNLAANKSTCSTGIYVFLLGQPQSQTAWQKIVCS
jgi:hypothetical protein